MTAELTRAKALWRGVLLLLTSLIASSCWAQGNPKVAAVQPSDGAAVTRPLAAEAVTLARTMAPGRERDVTLREISRNLRHAHRDIALEAARAMSEDYEVKSFGPGPDELTQALLRQVAGSRQVASRCSEFARTVATGRAQGNLAQREAEARRCYIHEGPVPIDGLPTPPFEDLIRVADALPAGDTKAQLLSIALYTTWDELPSDQGSIALAHLRSLQPHLSGEAARQVAQLLDSYQVDLLDGRPAAAIERLRAHSADPAHDHPLNDPETNVAALISDLIRRGEQDNAIAALQLLKPGAECALFGDGLGKIYTVALSNWYAEPRLADFLDRFLGSTEEKRLCPRGVDPEMLAELEVRALRPEQAIVAAGRSTDAGFAAGIRNRVAREWLQRGEIERARPLILALAAELPSLAGSQPMQFRPAARARIETIVALVAIGEVARAVEVARAFPGPGWRGFALSVIVGADTRSSAPSRWAGPFTDLGEVDPRT